MQSYTKRKLRMEWNGINLLLELPFLEQRFMRYHGTSSGNWPVVLVMWTAGRLPYDVRWYRMIRCSNNVSSSNRFILFHSFLLQLDDWEHSFLGNWEFWNAFTIITSKIVIMPVDIFIYPNVTQDLRAFHLPLKLYNGPVVLLYTMCDCSFISMRSVWLIRV